MFIFIFKKWSIQQAAYLYFRFARFQAFKVIVLEGGDARIMHAHHFAHQLRHKQVSLTRQEVRNAARVVILGIESGENLKSATQTHTKQTIKSVSVPTHKSNQLNTQTKLSNKRIIFFKK